MKRFPEGLLPMLQSLKAAKDGEKDKDSIYPSFDPVESFLTGMSDEEKEKYMKEARFSGFLTYTVPMTIDFKKPVGAYKAQITSPGYNYVEEYEKLLTKKNDLVGFKALTEHILKSYIQLYESLYALKAPTEGWGNEFIITRESNKPLRTDETAEKFREEYEMLTNQEIEDAKLKVLSPDFISQNQQAVNQTVFGVKTQYADTLRTSQQLPQWG